MFVAFPIPALKALWSQRIALFWPIWLSATTVAAAFTALAVNRAPMPKKQEPASDRLSSNGKIWSRSAIAAVAILAVFLSFYFVLMLTWDDFAHYDHSALTLFTLRGQPIAPPIWRQNGRFFPLGHQEFNLIGRVTHTITGYHLAPILQLLIVCGILFSLLRGLSIAARVTLVIMVLCIPSIMISYMGLLYPERNVIFWLAWMLLCVRYFDQKYSTAWAVAAIVCAQFMIYYKETAFVLLIGFAVGRMALRCRELYPAGWNFYRLRDKECRLDLCLASLGGLFLLYYLAIMFPHPNMQYSNDNRLPWTQLATSYLKADLLAIGFLVFLLVRAFMIVRRGVRPVPLWDALGLAGAIYFIAYLRLGMFSMYYMAPVDLIAILYVGRFVLTDWEGMRWRNRAVLASLLAVVVLQNVCLSAFSLFEEKNIVHTKVEIASLVLARYTAGAARPLRIFAPFASPFALMEFASYLDYRGVPVEGLGELDEGRYDVVLLSKGVTSEGPCVAFRPIICRPALQATSGDLVVTLPDDDVSTAEAEPYQHTGKMLASYQAYPRIPGWMCPVVRSLHIGSLTFGQKELPSHWLLGSVTVQK